MNLPAPWLSALKSSPVLASLGEFDFEVLVDALTRKALDPGQVLFRQGESGDSMVIVVDGSLDVLVREGGGGERVISQLGPGQVVGEMACVDPAPRSATVIARQRSWVFTLDRNLLRSLQEHAPAVIVSFYKGLIRVITTRLRETDERIGKEIQSVMGARVETGAPRKAPSGPRPRPRVHTGKVDIGAIPALSWLPARDFELLLAVAPPLVYAEGMELCHEGEPGVSCFLLLDGRVAVFKEVKEGRRRLATLEAGAFVGQLALVDRIPRSATVAADGNVIALEVARDVFERLLASATGLGIRFQEQIAIAGIRQLRMADLRLATVLEAQRRGGSNLPIPKEQEDARREAMRTYLRTALSEWGMSLQDLDKIQVVRPDGLVSPAEARARLGRK